MFQYQRDTAHSPMQILLWSSVFVHFQIKCYDGYKGMTNAGLDLISCTERMFRRHVAQHSLLRKMTKRHKLFVQELIIRS